MKRKLRRVELVVVPIRGKRRVYAISPLTVGPKAFDFYELMLTSFDKCSQDDQRVIKWQAQKLRRCR
jgi:hypothetical protein